MPCPISEFGAMIVTAPLGAMLMNAFGAKVVGGGRRDLGERGDGSEAQVRADQQAAAGERAGLDESRGDRRRGDEAYR